MERISLADSRLQYVGRIDRSDPEAPALIWAGSYLQLAFKGSVLRITIENHVCYNGLQIGFILDGTESQLMLERDSQPHCYEIRAAGNGQHRFILFKRQDSTHWFRLYGLETDGELCSLPPLPAFKMVCYGDSVTAGSVVEATDCVGASDPPVYDSKYDNAWHSYAMQTARLVGAQVHLVAQGGIALLDNTGYYDNGKYGMETAYDKLWYLPYEPMQSWDHSQFQPDLVTVAIGQNDAHRAGTDGNLCGAEREHWLERYCAFIRDLAEKYPKAEFLLMLTILMHDDDWEVLLDEACERIGSPRVKRFRFTRTGKATPGHPRIPEQCEMACELAEYILNTQHHCITD